MKKQLVCSIVTLVLSLTATPVYAYNVQDNKHANEDAEYIEVNNNESQLLNDSYILEVNNYIDEFYLNVNSKTLTQEESEEFSKGIEQIKDKFFSDRRGSIENKNTRATDYTGQLFIELESEKDVGIIQLRHGHAGIGDGTYVIEALNPTDGIKRQSATTRINSHFKPNHGKLYDVSYSGMSSDAHQKAAAWAKKQVGKKYDFDKEDDSGFFCSELVNEAWGRGAGQYLVKIIYYVSPEDLSYSGYTHFVKKFLNNHKKEDLIL